MEILDCYRVLEVPEWTTEDEVRAAYRDMVQVWHPDRFQTNVRLRERVEDKLKDINLAFQMIARAEFPETPVQFETGMVLASPIHTGKVKPAYNKVRQVSRTPRFIYAWIAALALLQGGMSIPNLYSPQPFEPRNMLFVGQKSWTGKMAGASVQKVKSNPAVPVVSQKIAVPNGMKGVTLSKPKPAVYAVAIPYTGPTYTYGSSITKVRAIQGEPDSIDGLVWKYGSSTIQFSPHGFIVGFSNFDNNLRVKLAPPAWVRRGQPFTIGSSKAEVAASMGTPTSLDEDLWLYRFSGVNFDQTGKVVGYTNYGGNLKVRYGNGTTQGAVSGITTGMTRYQTLKLAPNPLAVKSDQWEYPGFTLQFGKAGRITKITQNQRT